jgi:hypothetical protein
MNVWLPERPDDKSPNGRMAGLERGEVGWLKLVDPLMPVQDSMRGAIQFHSHFQENFNG